ncbi:MAG: hypothetical protein AAF192_10760 [Pseudomonadota bacterium]
MRRRGEGADPLDKLGERLGPGQGLDGAVGEAAGGAKAAGRFPARRRILFEAGGEGAPVGDDLGLDLDGASAGLAPIGGLERDIDLRAGVDVGEGLGDPLHEIVSAAIKMDAHGAASRLPMFRDLFRDLCRDVKHRPFEKQGFSLMSGA